jgi:TolB-like protein/DNA-binding winged helix-turn-helix (wHTH) protein/tetratricopeptide (TPR) repeat protein
VHTIDQRTGTVYGFGPYKADTKNEELRKLGTRIRLERKPWLLLILLLERQGEVVSRTELQRALWGDDTFVDFEQGLNVAVTKLRAALSDSPDTPRYIRTVAGEGYRFIADVENTLPAACEPSPTGSNSQFATRVLSSNPAAPPGSASPSSMRSYQPYWAGAAVVAVVAIAAAFIGVRITSLKPNSSPHPEKPMLVVMPFENLTGDATQEYLSDGMTEELSAELGNTNPKRLGVIARTSAMAYKNKHATISDIGKQLGVDYVLEGSVRRDGTDIRVTAQLVRVADQSHLWSESYDREMRDLFRLEDEIASNIVSAVGVSIPRTDAKVQSSAHVANPEAHDAYLLGRYYWNKRTPVGYMTAEKYFRQAIAKDPQYGVAYAGLCESFIPLPEAKTAALKAVQLDPNSGEAHTALGFINLFRELDLPAAERELKTAIQLDPNYATAHHWYSEVLGATGRFPEGLAEIKQAAKLDPLSLIIRTALAEMLSEAGQQDATLAQLKLVFAMDPHFAVAHEVLGDIYEERGIYEAAIHEYRLSGEYGRDLPGPIAYVYAISGRREQALNVLARLRESGASPFDLALVNVGLGRKENAISCLENLSLHPDDSLLVLVGDKRFAPLRSDPRFQALLRRWKLVP